MSHLTSKLICSFFILTSVSSRGELKTDTTKLLANNTVNTSTIIFTRTIVKQANILYPATLQNHMDQSLDYVHTFSAKKRQYLINTYQRGKSFFPKVAAVLKRYHLPQELKVLIALESAFNPNAVSGAGAVGYWQIMDLVAKEYGLQIVSEKEMADPNNKKKDDRKSFSKSTLAAAKYLRDRCKEFNNDLLLMVASYNCGAGNVRRAINKTGKFNPDFWDIKKYLPAETRSYVMNFIALNVIYENYNNFLKNKMVFDSEFINIPVIENIIKANTPVVD